MGGSPLSATHAVPIITGCWEQPVPPSKQRPKEGGQVPRAQSVTDADYDQEKDCSQRGTRASEQDHLASVRPGLKGQELLACKAAAPWTLPTDT